MAIESEVKIKEIIQRTYNVKSFRVETGEGVDFKAGQFLQVNLKARPELKRYLSISSSPSEKGYLEFTKKITESDFSMALDTLKPGDAVNIQYPFGNFTLNETGKNIAFISGGIGITPIRSICKFIVDKSLGIDIVLVYANRTISDIAFREDFQKMQEQCPKLKVVHVLSEASDELMSRSGRVNSQVIKEEIPDYPQRKFYLCGPPAMVEAMEKILVEELTLPKGNIITENFTGY
ncbi:MAG: FAD-dependent oxidoreductase [Candidatus Omnitrophica bacterium]|nr:FAD-dependent oxidoreductase [Candidatus Omnitrophota bacterium]MDD5592197.1 FAD-dependent oxidoreductase [Candidatus Omnitrophota bacterium]